MRVFIIKVTVIDAYFTVKAVTFSNFQDLLKLLKDLKMLKVLKDIF